MVKRILLIVILAASISCQTPSTTIKGCFQWNTFTNSCSLCYQRAIQGSKCGPLLPSNSLCLIHKEQVGSPVNCDLCRPGYSLTEDGQCKVINIFGCVRGVIRAGKSLCLACGGGLFPAKDQSGCAPIPSTNISYVANCVWGASNGTCYKCAPGFVVGSNATFCTSETTTTKGCYQLNRDNQTCFVCDAFDGYSMQKDGSCKFINQ